MAYRPLQVRDEVRITHEIARGKQGIVVSIGLRGRAALVEYVHDYRHPENKTSRWFNQSKLVILANTPIKDAPQTPCEKLGYKVGDQFRVKARDCGFEAGQLVSLYTDDRTSIPLFSGENHTFRCCHGNPGAYLALTNVEPVATKQIQPQKETQVTVFKIGDKVKIVHDNGFEPSNVGKHGTIDRIDPRDSQLPIHVRFSGELGSDWGRASGLELVTQVAVESPKFKVGDRIRIIEDNGFDSDSVGKVGVIEVDDKTSLPLLVRFEDGESDWGKYSDVELIVEIPTASIKEKLAQIDKLSAEIREMLG